jgi:outer membrane protein OmpA-like peptidoglycan-associated protein
MKYELIICYCLLVGIHGLHAQNLVANGSFEDENICTEYQKNCAPEAWIATSLYSNYYYDGTMRGASKGYHGTHFIALTAGNIVRPGMRNFLRTRLLCGMQKGHQYQLQFYIRANNAILDSIGAYFSANDFLGERRYFKLITPQLWTTDGMEKTGVSPSVWQQVRLIYTADGTEGYITIGNFKRDDYTGIHRGDDRYDYNFYLDSVSLTPVDPKEKLCAEADSVRREIYLEDYRHNYLEKKVYYMRRNPPAVIPLPKTKQERIQHIDTLIIPDIFFATARYELTPASFHLLDSFASKLSTLPIDSMVVEGHTDSIGKLAYNEALSLNRANSVGNYLSGKVQNLQQKTITRGYAWLRPVASNKTPKGRQHNRRVEIFVYRRE